MRSGHIDVLEPSLRRQFRVLVCGVAGAAGLFFVSTTLAGVVYPWIEVGSNPWSQVHDLGGVGSALVMWPVFGVLFVGSELIAAFFASGMAGHLAFIGVTAGLLGLWAVAWPRTRRPVRRAASPN